MTERDHDHRASSSTFAADLAALGDDLQAAVAREIAASRPERNNPERSNHLLDVTYHHEEHPMTDTETTDTTPASDRPVVATTLAPTAGRSTRSRKLIALGALGGALAIGGAAAAAGVFSADTIERGMPGGSAIFAGTDPTCTTSDDVVFECTLAHPPTAEILVDHTDSAQLIVDDESRINGGCRGQDAEGLRWTCYVGDRAVEEGILVAELLGQQLSGPSHG
jgi:hypothetical protein